MVFRRIGIIATVILFAVIAFCAVSIYSIKAEYDVYTSEAEGVIVNATMQHVKSDHILATYKLQYEVDGETLVNTPMIRYNGDSCTILYNPDDVDKCIIKGDIFRMIAGSLF